MVVVNLPHDLVVLFVVGSSFVFFLRMLHCHRISTRNIPAFVMRSDKPFFILWFYAVVCGAKRPNRIVSGALLFGGRMWLLGMECTGVVVGRIHVVLTLPAGFSGTCFHILGCAAQKFVCLDVWPGTPGTLVAAWTFPLSWCSLLNWYSVNLAIAYNTISSLLNINIR